MGRDEDPDIPRIFSERGFPRRWLLLAGILLVATNLRASITTVGPLAADVQYDLGLSAAEVSFLITMPLIVFAALSPLAPPLAKRIGIEKSLAISLGLLSIAIVVRSLPWVPALWIGTAGLGAAIAVINVLLPPLVKRDFPLNVGRVTGFYASAQSGMAAFASAFAVPIADQTDWGWRLAFGVWAGLALISLAILLPLAIASSKTRDTSGLEITPAKDSLAAPLRAPWKARLGWAVALFSGFQALFYFTVLAWWPTIEQLSGVSQVNAGIHQGVWQIVAIVASLLAGILLHRLKNDARMGVIIFAVPTMLGISGQLLWPSLSLLWIVLLGIGIGGTFVVSISLIGLRTLHPLQTARLSALVQTVGYGVAALGPPLAGGLAEFFSTWSAALIMLLVLQFVQVPIALFAARPGHI